MATSMDAMLKIRAQVDGANNIIQLNRGLQSVETTAKGVTGAMRGMTGAAAGLSGALGTLTPLLTVAGLVGMVKNTIEAGDRMHDLAQSTGVSVEALSRFKKAAAVSGTDIEGVSKSLVKLSKAMLDASTGGAASQAAFNALGISVTKSNGQLKSSDAVMIEIANRFKAMPDGVTKTALALKLFGRAGAEMIPLLNMGGDSIDKLKVKMTSAFADKMDEYKDRLAVLSGKVGALGMDLTVALLPALEAVTVAVTTAVDAFNQLPDVVKGLAVAGATLAIAWGPITGALKVAVSGFQFFSAGIATAIEYVAAIGISFEGLAVAFTDLGFALAAVPVGGWIAAAVAGLAALGIALYQNSEGFRNWANTSLNFVKVLASDGMGTMQKFGQWLSSMWSSLVSTAKGVGSAIAQAFSGPFGVIANVAKAVFGFVGQQIAALYNMLPEGVRKAIGGVGTYVQGAWNKAAGMAGAGGGKANQGGGGAGFNPDLGALNTGGGAAAAKKTADEANKLQMQIRQTDELGKLLHYKILIQDIDQEAARLQAAGNVLGALDLKQQSIIAERASDHLKIVQDTQRKLDENAQATDQSNRKLKDQAVTQEGIRQQAELEVQTRGKLLDVEQQITAEKKRQAKEQADAMRSIQDRAKYQRIGDFQGGEQAARQRELDDLERQKKEQPERADDIQKRIDALKKSWAELDAMANNAAYGLAKGLRGYLDSIGTMADAVANTTKGVVQNLEDKLMEFFSTGKFEWRDFANYAIQQIQRIVLQQLILKPIINAISGGLSGLFGSANGNVFAQNGIVPYAMGGVINQPTLFKFANGGAGKLGLMGEAGPEAIIPLRRGRDGKLGVAGGGGTNVVVNVDAKGTSVQGDNTQGAALGRAVSQAVQAELVRQRRPGGLLAA